jgi:hypothetical protein
MSPCLTAAPAGASRPQLERHGYRLLGAPESFLVSKQGTLLKGEVERATAWGASVGEEAAFACLASG